MSTVAILPVKDFRSAKSRLAEGFGLGHRRALAEAMYADVLVAVRRAPSVTRIIVVTKDATASRIAAGHGITVLDDSAASHSEAAVLGITAALSQGAARALVLAADCPMVTSPQLEELLAYPVNGDRSAVIVPDRHGTGTNALLLTPPDALRPAFGEGSCERHATLAQEQGASAEVVSVPTLGLDIDTPDDLEVLRQTLEQVLGGAAHTRGLFAQLERGAL